MKTTSLKESFREMRDSKQTHTVQSLNLRRSSTRLLACRNLYHNTMTMLCPTTAVGVQEDTSHREVTTWTMAGPMTEGRWRRGTTPLARCLPTTLITTISRKARSDRSTQHACTLQLRIPTLWRFETLHNISQISSTATTCSLNKPTTSTILLRPRNPKQNHISSQEAKTQKGKGLHEKIQIMNWSLGRNMTPNPWKRAYQLPSTGWGRLSYAHWSPCIWI